MTSPSRQGRPPKVNGLNPDTRERLLESAVAAFLDSGFEGVTLDQVAQRAGVTSGAIYNHFSGKSDLLFEAARWVLSKVPTQTDHSHAELADAVPRFFLPSSASHARGLVVELNIAALRHPDIAEMLNSWRGERLAGEAALPGMSPAKLKVCALLATGLCHLDTFEGFEAPTDEMSDAIRRAFRAVFEDD